MKFLAILGLIFSLGASAAVNVTLTKDNMLVMNDYFSGTSVANLAQQARKLDAKMPAKDPLFIVLNSGGGSIDAGIELIENLNRLNRPVHTITIFSASMAFQTVQGVKGQRLVQANGTLMSHKARGGFSGEFPGQLDARYGYYLRRVQNLDKQVVGRTAGKHTLKTYASLIENEYWCDGEDCITQGFADKIVNASCDSSLNGTHDVLFDRFMYAGHIIEIMDVYSDCPMITTELDYQIYIDGTPLFNTFKNKSATNSWDDDAGEALRGMGLETTENIKKLVQDKMNSRTAPSKLRQKIVYY